MSVSILSIHYRSLSIKPAVDAWNSRSQAEIKLKHWHNAMRDCQKALGLEGGNLKGVFIFRTTAL